MDRTNGLEQTESTTLSVNHVRLIDSPPALLA